MIAEKLTSGGKAIGTMLRLVRNPAMMPLAKHAGMDFVMLDMEHGPYAMTHLADLSIAAHGVGLGLMVRVPDLSRGHVSRALDMGADGVMVPMLETSEQAEKLVEWGKYAPQGGRGLSSFGAQTNYQAPGDVVEYMARANRETLLIAQMETRLATENADAIAATPGIDVLLVGPNDLAVSLGCPGQLDSPAEEAAIATIAQAAQAHGKVFGMHAGTAMLERWVSHDMRMIMNDIDIKVMARGLKTLAGETRQLAGL